MSRAGIEVRTNTTGLMHHKYCILDGICVLNGSFNWTSTAASENAENVMVTADRSFVDKFQRHFEQMWNSYKGSVYRPGLVPLNSREITLE